MITMALRGVKIVLIKELMKATLTDALGETISQKH